MKRLSYPARGLLGALFALGLGACGQPSSPGDAALEAAALDALALDSPADASAPDAPADTSALPDASAADAPAPDAASADAQPVDGALEASADAPASDAGGLLGASCGADRDCAAGLLCAPGAAGTRVCSLSCAGAAACASLPGTRCAPRAAGDATGYCAPSSPAHCAACATDADCGGSARCLQAPGDSSLACHLDCSLDASVCPSDYTCASVPDGSSTRRLCMPPVPTCLDALGGYCNASSLPLDCARSNTAGMCVGQRACLASSGRYDRCGASAPQVRADCATPPAPGCTTSLAPSAISTVTNCGACGNVCPGYGLATADAACASTSPPSCAFTCRGDNYDVNNSADDGCEQQDSASGGHTQATSTARPSHDCADANVDTFMGTVVSDARVHANPSVPGFVTSVGAAPDWWSVPAAGGTFCVNDVSATLTVTGGTPSCYRLTVLTDRNTTSASANAAGTATLSLGSGSYSDGSTIYFRVEKTCSLPARESVSYAVSYHL